MWVGIMMLVELAAITLWKRWHRIFPSHYVSEVYTRYACAEGIDIAFIKDFKLNDTIFVDVTLLEAKNDSSWMRLQKDFNVAPPPKEILMEATNDIISFRYAPKKSHSLPMDPHLTNNDIIAVSHLKKCIAVFHINSEKQINIIYKNQIEKNEKENE